jgi:hypothetical protein
MSEQEDPREGLIKAWERIRDEHARSRDRLIELAGRGVLIGPERATEEMIAFHDSAVQSMQRSINKLRHWMHQSAQGR